jgi:hypothetical protein
MSTNGIDFVIGGKDQAKPAMSAVEQSLQRLEQKTDSLTSSTKMLTSITGGLAVAYGAIKSAMAMLGGIDAVNAAYDESAESVKGLETALRLQSTSVETESARLQDFASSMQSMIGAEDDATLAMMKQASIMGVATEDLDDMAKAAIGLGEAMETSAESGMEMMRRAQEGNFMAFQKQFPAMKQMQTDSERLAFVTELAAKGLEAKADASNRVAGMGDRANNAIGDLMESVGALLAPVRILISAGITTLAESLSELLVPAVAYAEEVLANIGPIMDWVKEKVIQGVNLMVGAFTFFEVIITNLDQVWAMVVAQAELYMLQLIGVVAHALTEVIPAYAGWFADNFVNLIRDGLILAFTVVTNHVAKIVDAFAALWEYIASWGESDIMGQLGEISGRSYLDGFESSLTALPEIMGRTISEREKELAGTVGQIGANLGDEFSRKMQERMIEVGAGAGDELNTAIDLKMNALGEDGSKASKRKDGTLGASINAMESRLLTRGPGSTFEQQMIGRLDRIAGLASEDGDRMQMSVEELKNIGNKLDNNVLMVPAI